MVKWRGLRAVRMLVVKRGLAEESVLGVEHFWGGLGKSFAALKWFLTLFSQCLRCSQEKVRAVFDNLIQLEHLNIVKFHKYWADIKENKARVRTFSWAYREETS